MLDFYLYQPTVNIMLQITFNLKLEFTREGNIYNKNVPHELNVGAKQCYTDRVFYRLLDSLVV